MVIGILSSGVGLDGGRLPIFPIVLRIMEYTSVGVMLTLLHQLKTFFQNEKEYFDIACDRISQPREYSETELEARELKQPEFKQLNLFDIA